MKTIDLCRQQSFPTNAIQVFECWRWCFQRFHTQLYINSHSYCGKQAWSSQRNKIWKLQVNITTQQRRTYAFNHFTLQYLFILSPRLSVSFAIMPRMSPSTSCKLSATHSASLQYEVWIRIRRPSKADKNAKVPKTRLPGLPPDAWISFVMKSCKSFSCACTTLVQNLFFRS